MQVNDMVAIINIKNGIKEPTHGYQNTDTSQILISGGYVKVRESLHTQGLFWVDTILCHIDTTAILLEYEGS